MLALTMRFKIVYFLCAGEAHSLLVITAAAAAIPATSISSRFNRQNIDMILIWIENHCFYDSNDDNNKNEHEHAHRRQIAVIRDRRDDCLMEKFSTV